MKWKLYAPVFALILWAVIGILSGVVAAYIGASVMACAIWLHIQAELDERKR